MLGEAVQGRAGNFSRVVNNGDTGPGGGVHPEAGNTTDVLEMGGTLVMTAGAPPRRFLQPKDPADFSPTSEAELGAGEVEAPRRRTRPWYAPV